MSITPDMSFWVNTLIATKLKEVCSSLDLNVQDRKVLDTCLRDFRNYTVYLEHNHLKVEEEDEQNMFAYGSLALVITQQGVMYQNLKTTKETAEFVDMWVKMWWKKWLERTKIVVSNDQLPKNALRMGGGPPSVAFSPEEMDELLGVTIMKLIQYGEICCTQILGDNLVKKAIADMKGKELPDKLNLIAKLSRQAKEICYIHGTLIFIKPDENYYKMREWRDGDSSVSKAS